MIIIFSNIDIYYIIIMVNGMNKLNSRGFTLIELIATIVLLSLVMGIGAYSITSIINKSREKDYEFLIMNIRDSVMGYYQECKFVNNNCVYEMDLGYLVRNGYLKGNNISGENTFILLKQ